VKPMVKEKAYAKINLFLNVVNKRLDGYHDLEMVMASLKLHDVLSFQLTEENDIELEINTEITPSPKHNIVYKVASFLQEEFAISKGVEIKLEKNIPLSAGLAGGSADAAATFRGLNKLWNLNLSLSDMAKLGEGFGADIPFCIYNKLCVAKGKGHELAFINQKFKTNVVLVNPNVPMSTKLVFDTLTEEDLVFKKISDMILGISDKNYDLVIRELHNSLEKISFEIEPKVRTIKNQMIDWGLDGALMCGSGATVFGLARKKNKLVEYSKTVPDEYTTIITKLR